MSDEVVRAKFKCNTVTEQIDWEGNHQWSYEFSAVTASKDASEENKTFWKYTPSGQVKLTAIRSDLFEIGKEYYLDFIRAS